MLIEETFRRNELSKSLSSLYTPLLSMDEFSPRMCVSALNELDSRTLARRYEAFEQPINNALAQNGVRPDFQRRSGFDRAAATACISMPRRPCSRVNILINEALIQPLSRCLQEEEGERDSLFGHENIAASSHETYKVD